jgi:hypothetical protein
MVEIKTKRKHFIETSIKSEIIGKQFIFDIPQQPKVRIGQDMLG